jgi:hypothetical protein
MPRKNVLSIHEAIAVAPLNNKKREATFDEVASFIEQRDLYPERKGVVSLADQVILRATKSVMSQYLLFLNIMFTYYDSDNILSSCRKFNVKKTFSLSPQHATFLLI